MLAFPVPFILQMASTRDQHHYHGECLDIKSECSAPGRLGGIGSGYALAGESHSADEIATGYQSRRFENSRDQGQSTAK